jgi:hypothetical protein
MATPGNGGWIVTILAERRQSPATTFPKIPLRQPIRHAVPDRLHVPTRIAFTSLHRLVEQTQFPPRPVVTESQSPAARTPIHAREGITDMGRLFGIEIRTGPTQEGVTLTIDFQSVARQRTPPRSGRPETLLSPGGQGELVWHAPEALRRGWWNADRPPLFVGQGVPLETLVSDRVRQKTPSHGGFLLRVRP